MDKSSNSVAHVRAGQAELQFDEGRLGKVQSPWIFRQIELQSCLV